MAEWWEALTTLGRVLACIAIPATLLLVIQTVMALIGLGGGSDADGNMVGDDVDLDGDGVPDGVFGSDTPDTEVETETGGDSGFRLLSLRSIIAFFAVFGWVGLIMQKNGASVGLTLLVSIVSGFAAMTLVALLIAWMLRLQADGTKNIRNALGRSGTVYLRIPADRDGKGKVNVLLQDSLVELDAVTDENVAIASGREIVVIGLSGQNTVVVKTK